jgi:hypothetical protein
MSWTITPQTKVPVDPQYGSVSLLLHGNQSGGQFIDSSPTPKSITKVGDVAPGSPGGGTPIYPSSNSAFGSAIAFDKTVDRITCSSNDFAFGTGDFTIELWMYSRDVGDRGILQTSDSTGGLATAASNGIWINQGFPSSGYLYVNTANGTIATSSAVLTVNQWAHIAVTRSGTTCRLFANGTQVGTLTSASNLTATNLVVGGYYSTVYLFDGYIDDFRITKGVARYTANFTPPAAPFPDI